MNNELKNFINEASKKPELQAAFQEISAMAIQWCAEADKRLLKGQITPSVEEFDKAWKNLADKATKLGLTPPEYVYPHHVAELLTR